MKCLTERRRAHGRAGEEGQWIMLASTRTGGASQICMITEGGELIEPRVRTEASRSAEALEDRVLTQEVAVAETRCRFGQDV